MICVRCLWLHPGTIAERAARERGSTRSAYQKCLRLFLRNQAPAETTAQSIFSVEDRLKLLKHRKHRSQTAGPSSIQLANNSLVNYATACRSTHTATANYHPNAMLPMLACLFCLCLLNAFLVELGSHQIFTYFHCKWLVR
jgi:hypothetical protein